MQYTIIGLQLTRRGPVQGFMSASPEDRPAMDGW
jgi:hypothetical protein